ncbi:MAG: archaeosortase/exosortase family protein [Flavobacteriales bacterium]|nr:archaeosortase/exosortase family protein [Flavobacteriales bacterium]
MSTPIATPVVKGDPVLRFLALAAGLYLGWYLLFEFAIHPNGWLDKAAINSLLNWASAILRALGYELIPEPANAENIRTIGVQGGHLLWIGDPCNGIGLFAVYLIFLAAYPGPWEHKLWFAPLGVLSIHLINALRVAALCIIVKYDYELLNFNHDYTFYVIVYGWVFLLWIIWVLRYAKASNARPSA